MRRAIFKKRCKTKFSKGRLRKMKRRANKNILKKCDTHFSKGGYKMMYEKMQGNKTCDKKYSWRARAATCDKNCDAKTKFRDGRLRKINDVRAKNGRLKMIYEKMEANKKRDKKIRDRRFTNDRCKLKTTRAGNNVSQRNVVFKSGFELAQRGLEWWVVAQEL